MWNTRRGALRRLADTIRDALDEKIYLALKQPVIAYKNVVVHVYITHLDNKWCKMDTRVVKNMKNNYYRGWGVTNDEHIEEFVKRLNEEQQALIRDRVNINNEDKLQHFLGEMYEASMSSAPTFFRTDGSKG